MTSTRGKLALLALVPCLAFLALTSREGRTQDSRAVPTDVRVVNPNTAPAYTSVVNSASAPVQAKIVNALAAAVPANIINPATTPVQAKIVNGPASPVQTSLVGSPIVGAKQNGAWTVNVGNARTAPVRTRDASDTGRVFGQTVDLTIPDGEFTGLAAMQISTAANEYVLVEQVNVFLTLRNVVSELELVASWADPSGATLHDMGFPFTLQADDGSYKRYALHERTRFYHNPSLGNLGCYVRRTGVTETATGRFTVHGRIFTVP